ncbi:MAG: class I SAM-dependent methyltransferase [Chloroflexi bacterium]|nr:class I SAM-dependent methyltransferase [Chloroflexota bacterium]
MVHADHVRLLEPAGFSTGGVWADLGAGRGAFTLALRELTGSQAVIHAIDQDRRALKDLEGEYRARFGGTDGLILLAKDFSRPVNLPPLDGVLMANSLHFFKDHGRMLRLVASMLKPGGILLLVEYNVETGNPWVPYPLSFGMFSTLASDSGFETPSLLARRPSRFLREMYSASTHLAGTALP